MFLRKGYFLLALIIFFSILVLFASTSVLDLSTQRWRADERELKLNLANIRRGLDAYTGIHGPDSLDSFLGSDSADGILQYLASASFLRGRVMQPPWKWRVIHNLVRNSSFEEDGVQDYGAVDIWHGNFTSGDGVPNGWNLISNGIEQVVATLTAPATYVVSLRVLATGTSQITLKIFQGPNFLVESASMSIKNENWARNFLFFYFSSNQTARMEISQTGMNSGDTGFVDGVMLEKWMKPVGFPIGENPLPSAFTASAGVSSALATQSLSSREFYSVYRDTGSVVKNGYWFMF